MTDPAETPTPEQLEALLEEMMAKMGHHGIEDRPLSLALEAETPGDEALHARLRKTTVENALLIKDENKAKKVDNRFAHLDRFATPMGPVTIGHIPPAKEALQRPDQKEFVTGSRVELLLDNNVTLVEIRNMEGVELKVHARTLKITEEHLTTLGGLALQDVIALPDLVAKHFGAMVIQAVTDADGHILLTIAPGEARKANTASLPAHANTPMTRAIFERLSRHDQGRFAAALDNDTIFDGRIGAGVVRKIGAPGTIEITHIDPETLTQLKELNGQDYSITIAQAIPSHLVVQLEGMPVSEVSDMEGWMLEIFGTKTIKSILNASGNCTIKLN